MKNILIAAIAAVTLTACTDANNARRVLEASGYSDITTTGYRWTGCSKDDSVHTGFVAKGPTGKTVEGVVCQGWLPFAKSATVRID